MELVFDVETNGLLFDSVQKVFDKEQNKFVEVEQPAATMIYCIAAIDENDKLYTFDPTQIDEGLKFLAQADTLIGHNILGFDFPVIKKLRGVEFRGTKQIIDTLVLSRLSNPVREGGHSI